MVDTKVVIQLFRDRFDLTDLWGLGASTMRYSLSFYLALNIHALFGIYIRTISHLSEICSPSTVCAAQLCLKS